MIFITVGNGEFDELVREVDKLKEEGTIKDEVIIQIGLGKFQPQHCKWFTFELSLEKYYQKAGLIISHGGPGIVFEVLRKGKRLIAIPNRKRTDPRHQVEFLQALAEETSALIYCDSTVNLKSCLEGIDEHKFEKYHQPKCNIPDVISEFL